MELRNILFGIFCFSIFLLLCWLIDAIKDLNATLKQIRDKL
jgi:hypothetical protein